MTTADSIAKIFEEIRSYSGNFGDPIVALIDFNPIEVLRSGDKRLELGAGVALLVEFQNHIDNANYVTALKGVEIRDIQKALVAEFCREYPLITKAFIAASVSEEHWHEALIQVYCEHIKND